MIINPSKYGYEQLTSFRAFQVPDGKSYRSLLSHALNLKHLGSWPFK
jgi:hypothetical protein